MSDILHCDVCEFPSLPMCNWHAPKFYKELEAENTRLKAELAQAQNQLSDMSLLMAVNLDLEKRAERLAEALKKIVSNEFIYQNGIADCAKEALAEYEERKND